MKKILGLAILAFVLSACIEIKGDSDSSVDNSTNYGNGDVLVCTDSNCTAAPYGTDEGDGDAVVGVYNADYTQTECTAAGFFFCTIENMCLDQSITGGTCGS